MGIASRDPELDTQQDSRKRRRSFPSCSPAANPTWDLEAFRTSRE